MQLEKKEIAVIAVVVAVIVLLNPFLQLVTGTTSPMAVVRGMSMLPLFREGDVVFLVHKAPEEIKVGDIIVYRSLRGHLIIHRVIAIIDVGGSLEYITKGDNNPRDDSFLFEFPPGRGVSYDRIVGVVWSVDGHPFKIPYLGIITIKLS